MTNSPVLSSYLDKALNSLSKAGINFKTESSIESVLPLVQRLQDIDEANAINVARILQQSSAFNELARERISTVDIGSRYITIAEQFDSIREDTKEMVEWMSDGKMDWKEKAKLKWIELRRGTVSDRFDEIQDAFQSGIKSSAHQIDVEEVVLGAYKDFRFSLKEAETSAQEILSKATTFLDNSRTELQQANAKIDTAANPIDKSKLELARDVQISAAQHADEIFQIAKDLVDNLKISYNTSEVVFARLQQNIQLKQRIRNQSITFFSTNEILFTALKTAFTSTQGLAESTQALEQFKSGINQSLETLAEIGNVSLDAATRAGYGPTISAQSVQKLATAIVDYQERMQGMVAQLRQEATTNAIEIESATNVAKKRFVDLVARVEQ